MKEQIHIGLIGTRFMGRAHSNAYLKLPHFFDLPATPVLQTVCGRNVDHLKDFADRFHWRTTAVSWEEVVASPQIELVDISIPNNLHMPVAVAAAMNGKHVLCEKPIARNTAEALEMYHAVRKAGVVNMMIFNYRFVPAILLAKQMIEEGKIGEIRHFNAVYLQDWLTDPDFPIVWRHDVATSGSGAHGDMNAHTIDLARFLVGEVDSVSGMQKVFINERPLPAGSGKGVVSADDATSFLARFGNGAMGSFLATRLAPGRKNFLRLEIFGSHGSLSFDLEHLNELEFYDGSDMESLRGFRRILVTDSSHPLVAAWWPPGHLIGWEHSFVHQIKHLLEAVAQGRMAVPDFYDGVKCQQVLDAVALSASKGSWTEVSTINESTQ